MRLTALIFLLISNLSYSSIMTIDDLGRYSIASEVSYFISNDQYLEFSEVLANNKNINWIKNNKEDINFGFGDGVYWLKTSLQNNNAVIHDWALEFTYSPLDQIEIYLVKDEQLILYQLGGDTIPFDKKSIKYPHTVFPLHLIPNEPYDLFIRVESSGSIQVPMTIWQWDDFNENTLIHFLMQGLFFGFVIIMALYNLMVWVIERQRVYLNYVVYIISFSLFQSSLSGIGFQFIWPNLPIINSYITAISLSITLASFNYFIIDFFDMASISNKTLKLLNGFFYTFLGYSVLSILLPYYYSIIVLSTISIINIIAIISVATYMLKIKHISSRYFFLAWSGFLSGALLLALNKFGIIPINYFSEYTLQFGVALEIIFLSMALAERMSQSNKEAISLANQVNDEREKTFMAELDKLKLEKEANLNLEKTVADRTKKLTLALEHLSIAHEKLQTISITDALTEIHNRYYFNEHFKIEYKRAYREQSEISLIMLDVDHFKSVNDNYGHPAGDACLKYVARCIKQCAARGSDICCRYGGEEFVIILPSTPLINAYDLAEDIRQEILRQPVKWKNSDISLTASLGVAAVIPVKSDENHRQYLINQADQSLYKAKQSGRNKVVFFETEIL